MGASKMEKRFWTFLSYEPYRALIFRITSSIATMRPAYMWQAKFPYSLQ
ncbi:hypothetical protein XM74_c21237 [Vibrio vulnificus]|nr:hypothetical protein XM74_c21237 [Vibrio vulnificus]